MHHERKHSGGQQRPAMCYGVVCGWDMACGPPGPIALLVVDAGHGAHWISTVTDARGVPRAAIPRWRLALPRPRVALPVPDVDPRSLPWGAGEAARESAPSLSPRQDTELALAATRVLRRALRTLE